MNANEVLTQLSTLGSDSYKKIFLKHGAVEPFYGVKIEELKKFQKKIKKNYELSLELYDSGISDAMYLAGLIADESRMTKSDLQRWVEKATWGMLSESTVGGVAADSPHGWDMAIKWIDSPVEKIALSGWATLSGLVAVRPDDELPLKELQKLLNRVAKEIHHAPDKIRYVMNGFVISVGTYVVPLHDKALATAEKIGKVDVDMGDTECKVPLATQYIEKVKNMGRVGKKRKSARC
jgi:hypothetical protein